MKFLPRSLYPRWILANGFAEAVGLGATLVIGRELAPRLPALGSGGEAIATIGLAVMFGAVIEGAIVGLAQAWAVAAPRPDFPVAAWVRASVGGAALAWLLGMVPGVLAGGGGAEAPSAAGPGLGLTLMVAAVIGAVAGPVLAVVQWRVLRRVGVRAGRWIGANALAWLVGMPIIFAAMETLPEAPGWVRFVVTVAVGCLVAGTVVGAIHGRVLVRILRPVPG